MKNNTYDNFFANFANKTKFKIIMALQEKSLSVTEIIEATSEEQSKISHNLKKLAQSHVLEVKKQGKKHIYSLNKETVIPILELVKTHVRKNCLLGKCCK